MAGVNPAIQGDSRQQLSLDPWMAASRAAMTFGERRQRVVRGGIRTVQAAAAHPDLVIEGDG